MIFISEFVSIVTYFLTDPRTTANAIRDSTLNEIATPVCLSDVKAGTRSCKVTEDKKNIYSSKFKFVADEMIRTFIRFLLVREQTL